MKFLTWIGGNLTTLFVSILLAVVIWVSAVTAANPNIETDLVVPLVVQNQPDDITLIDEVPPTASLKILAPQTVIEQIQQDDLIAASINLSGLESGTYRFPVILNYPDQVRPIRVLEYTPRQLELTLGKITDRQLPLDIQVIGEPAIGYKTGKLEWRRGMVTVSGREDLVEEVTSVVGVLDISDASETVAREVSLQPRDENDQLVENLTLEPNSIRVTQVINLQGGYRNVAVNVVTEGLVEPGYRPTSITPAPPSVMVFSEDPQLVEQLPGYVNTKPLDLTGVDNYLETILELDLPQGVTVVGDPTVLVQVNVTPLETNVLVAREIEVIGLLPGLTAEVSPQQVSIRISGPVPTLDNLTLRDIRVIVDLTNYEAGIHTVTPTVEILPTDVVLEDISPTTVEIRIESGPTPTPGS